MADDADARRFSLLIRYSGGLADLSTLQLDEYAHSLNGWQQLFRLASDIFVRSVLADSAVGPAELLEIRVVAEKKGSFLTVVEFVLAAYTVELIKKTASANYETFIVQLTSWYRSFVTNHIRVKSATTNIEELAEALRLLALQSQINLEAHDVRRDEELPLIDIEEDDQVETVSNASQQRQISEKLDEQLKAATEPLESSCTHVLVTDEENVPLISIGAPERAIIVDPLTLPPPKREWVHASVHFVRIHRKTGRAMFYFKGESESTHGAHFSRIIDSRIKSPGNPYTSAFNDNSLLDVWVRQRAAPKGRLNIQWDITVQPPDFGGLFP